MKALCLRLAVMLSALAVLTGAHAQQAALPSGVQRITTVEGITEYRLDNGLRVLLFRDASKATVTVNMTYLVGSVDESYGETGMAHLLEHMLFKGSPKHPEVFSELQDHGAQFNGTTAWDRTNYFETFDASDANLEWAIDLEADRMVNSFVAQVRPRQRDDGRAQRVRVRREQPDARAVPTRAERRLRMARLRQLADRQPQRHRERADRAAAALLSSNQYQPDNAVLVVAGRFEEARALELIAKSFGAIPKPQRVLDRQLHRRARAGRRARGDRAPRRRHPDPDGRVPRGRGRARGLRAAAARDQRARRRAVGPALQGARRDGPGGSGRRADAAAQRPGRADLRRDGSRGRVARQGARGDVRGDRRPRGQPDHGRRDRTRARTTRCRASSAR